MNYIDYVGGITFRFIKPDTPLSWNLAKLLDGLSRLGFPLESWITKLPSEERYMKRSLRRICKIPKMSTFSIGAIINRGVASMPEDQAFVNVGIWHGFTLLSGMVNNGNKTCVGIDNFSRHTQHGEREKLPGRLKRYGSSNHHFHDMDYRKYFAEVHAGPIGFYLYDGEHSYNNQLEALRIAEPYFSKNCIILIDDANADDPRRATMDFIARSPNRYRTILDQTTYCDRHPTLWNGIMIIQRIDAEQP